MERKAYGGPSTLLDFETYHNRRQQVAQVQSDLMNGNDAVAAAVTTLIEYQDDLKYIRFLEQELRSKAIYKDQYSG